MKIKIMCPKCRNKKLVPRITLHDTMTLFCMHCGVELADDNLDKVYHVGKSEGYQDLKREILKLLGA